MASALIITPQIEEDARRLAEATGVTPTDALATALRQQLQLVLKAEAPPRKSVEEIMAMIRSYNLEPNYDLTEDEILGYDEFGIPEQPYIDPR